MLPLCKYQLVVQFVHHEPPHLHVAVYPRLAGQAHVAREVELPAQRGLFALPRTAMLVARQDHHPAGGAAGIAAAGVGVVNAVAQGRRQ